MYSEKVRRRCASKVSCGKNHEEYRIGVFRPSMDQNVLLYKPEVGKSRRSYSIPNNNFIYGKPYCPTDGGVAEAMIHLEHDPKKRKKAKPKNFIRLNMEAVQYGLVTAKENSRYREANDRRVHLQEGKKWKNVNNFPPDMTFGIMNKPSTPMFDIMEHKYQKKWLKDKHDALKKKEDYDKFEKERNKKLYVTRMEMLRRHQPPADHQPRVWRMEKYLQMPPHLETFETAEKRRAAFKHYQHDALSRRGLFGHGIYEPAIS